MRNLSVFVFILVSWSIAVAAKPKIAVMDIHDRSNKFSKELLENATEMIRGKLSATGRFMVIDRSSQQEKMKQIIGKEKKESYNQNYDKESQIPLGRALAADSILRSTISCLGNDCMLTAEIVDIAREVSTKGGTSKFVFDKSDLSSLIAAIEDVIEQMADMGSGELSTKSSPYHQEDISVDPNASYTVIFDANEKAEVFIDGARICKSTPCQQIVQGGTRNVRMVSKKMPPQEETITFYRNERIVFQFISGGGSGITITPMTRKGRTITGVTVLSGKNVIGTAPGTFSLSPDDNRLLLTRSGFKNLKLKVNPNSDLNLSPVMDFDTYRPYKGGAIAGFVVGGILFVGGAVGYLVAETMDAIGEDAGTAFLVSYSMMGIGIGGIVLGAVLISIKRPVPGSEGFTFNFSGNSAKLSYTYNF